MFYYWFYVFIIGFSVVNLRKIQKEAAGPGPGRTWAGPGLGLPPLFGFLVLFYRFRVTLVFGKTITFLMVDVQLVVRGRKFAGRG